MQVYQSCQELLFFPPPPHSFFNFLNCHSWLVLHFSPLLPPSSGQTHRRAKQFLHLHAWGDTVSFKHTWTLEKMHGAAGAAALQAWIPTRGEPLSPWQLVISVRIMREKFDCWTPFSSRKWRASEWENSHTDFSMVIDAWIYMIPTWLYIIYRKDVAVHHQGLHNPQSIVCGSAPIKVWRNMPNGAPSRLKEGSGDVCTHTKLSDDKKR